MTQDRLYRLVVHSQDIKIRSQSARRLRAECWAFAKSPKVTSAKTLINDVAAKANRVIETSPALDQGPGQVEVVASALAAAGYTFGLGGLRGKSLLGLRDLLHYRIGIWVLSVLQKVS
jgi:hypothetical protein